MTVYIIRRDTGKVLVCEACREHIRSGDGYSIDSPFCARKRCIKKRAKKAERDAANDLNQGGPA